MGILFNLIGAVCGIGSLACFIMVVVQMCQHGQTGLGIATGPARTLGKMGWRGKAICGRIDRVDERVSAREDSQC